VIIRMCIKAASDKCGVGVVWVWCGCECGVGVEWV